MYDAQPHKNGSRGALFSDGAVLFLAAAEQKAVTLRKVRKEWLTPAETRLLAKLTPKLRVVNHRFSSLEVKVGGSTLGAVAKGRTRTFAVAARNLPLVLVAKTISTKPVKMRFRNAVIEIVRIPRHRDLPVIPIHEYLRAFRQEDPGQKSKGEKSRFRPVISGGRPNEIKGPDESVLPAADKPLNVSMNRDWIHGAIRGIIKRRTCTIAGLNGGVIRVKVNRLAEGEVRTAGRVRRFRNTALGTVELSSAPDTSLARYALITEPRPAATGADPDRPGLTPSHEPESRRGQTREISFKGQRPRISNWIDFQAIAPLLRTRGQAALPLLWKELDHALKSPRRPTAAAPTQMDPSVQTPDGPSPLPAALRIALARSPGKPSARQPASEQPLTPAEIIAAIGFFADKAQIPPLAELLAKRQSDRDAAKAAFVAIGQIGSSVGARHIADAASKTQSPAPLVALAMIDTGLARRTLNQRAAASSALLQAMRHWPQVAGSLARRNFVRAVCRNKETIAKSPDLLPECVRLDPRAAEQAILKLLASDEEQPAEKKREKSQEKTNVQLPVLLWQALCHLHNADTVKMLLAKLDGEKEAEAAPAARALVQAADPAIAKALAAGLGKGKPEPRAHLVKALLAIGDSDAIARLTSAMNPKIAFAFVADQARALARQYGKPAVARLLVKMYKATRPAAEKKAGPADDGPHRPDLGPETTPTAHRLTDIITPAEAVAALGQVGCRDKEVLETLHAALKSKDPRLRAAAINATAQIQAAGSFGLAVLKFGRSLLGKPAPSGPSPAARLAAGMVEDADPTARKSAVEALGVLARAGRGHPQTARLICKALADKNPEVRRAAARVAGQAPHLSMAGPLAALFERIPHTESAAARPAHDRGSRGPADEPLAVLVVRALGSIRDKSCSEVLLERLGDKDPQVRREAVIALGRIGNPADAPDLAARLADSDPEVQAAALAVLGKLKSPEAARRLGRMLQQADLSDAQRLLVIHCLLKINDAHAYKALAAAVTNDEKGAKLLHAVVAMAHVFVPRSRSKGYVRFLAPLLDLSNQKVRSAAAAGMAVSGDAATAASILTKAVKKNPGGIVPQTAHAIGRSRDAAYLPLLAKLAQDEGEKKRRAQRKARGSHEGTRPEDQPEPAEGEPQGTRPLPFSLPAAGPTRPHSPHAAILLAMGQIRTPAAVRQIRRVLSEWVRDPEDARAGIRALVQSELPEAALLLAGNWRRLAGGAVKADAVRALASVGRLSPQSAKKALKLAMKDRDPEVSALAADALDAVTGK